ncbi:MAG: aminotransferase class I/II-fold pyridoxal phosphate-dependent enzyme [Saprospiraceae bacterium]
MPLNETTPSAFRISSHMAETLIPSEIIKLAAEVNHKIQAGEHIFNLTIGDFNPSIFPIPKGLEKFIIKAYQEGHTNYPAANGMVDLRQVLSTQINEKLGLHYSADEILISGGARPLIYAIYKTLLDRGDTVLYPVPSWNNNHYCHLCEANGIALEVNADQNFMPTAADFEPHIQKATLIALCSPQNPTGTVFTEDTLRDICKLVLTENIRRKGIQKPLYIMYDQIYWELSFGDTKHFDPVSLIPELRDYVIYVDGLSKVYAATGIRVGWSFGPRKIMDQMRAILSHIGAWAPKAEQMATAWFIKDQQDVQSYLDWFKPEIHTRLTGLYEGILNLKHLGYPIDIIHPQAAIYLTVKCPWKNKKTAEGRILQNQIQVTDYILNVCKVGIVPFKAFGASEDSEWYRISVGTLKKLEIAEIVNALKSGMDQLMEV